MYAYPEHLNDELVIKMSIFHIPKGEYFVSQFSVLQMDDWDSRFPIDLNSNSRAFFTLSEMSFTVK
jgi:hypothetical protein